MARPQNGMLLLVLVLLLANCFREAFSTALGRDRRRVAVGIGRFEAATGRLPATLEEVGVAVPLGHSLGDFDPEWKFGRRALSK